MEAVHWWIQSESVEQMQDGRHIAYLLICLSAASLPRFSGQILLRDSLN